MLGTYVECEVSRNLNGCFFCGSVSGTGWLGWRQWRKLHTAGVLIVYFYWSWAWRADNGAARLGLCIETWL
jgi:hypothetical protein